VAVELDSFFAPSPAPAPLPPPSVLGTAGVDDAFDDAFAALSTTSSDPFAAPRVEDVASVRVINVSLCQQQTISLYQSYQTWPCFVLQESTSSSRAMGQQQQQATSSSCCKLTPEAEAILATYREMQLPAPGVEMALRLHPDDTGATSFVFRRPRGQEEPACNNHSSQRQQ
jgi:hypothetical protein